ncbi:hypothetical protein VPHD472_0102 [Vibrio phage D472]
MDLDNIRAWLLKNGFHIFPADTTGHFVGPINTNIVFRRTSEGVEWDTRLFPINEEPYLTSDKRLKIMCLLWGLKEHGTK